MRDDTDKADSDILATHRMKVPKKSNYSTPANIKTALKDESY